MRAGQRLGVGRGPVARCELAEKDVAEKDAAEKATVETTAVKEAAEVAKRQRRRPLASTSSSTLRRDGGSEN